ncbi:MAG TPA: peptidase M16 [Bacteroidales bacterium]|nr:peptidase M16 [Bacteroidales bacterium]
MKRTRTVIPVILLLLLNFVGFAQKIEFEEYDLENGLHVILHQDHSTPIVNVSILYHVGSKNEPANRTGFAHFFEHLMFEGSANIPRGEYTKHVERAGGVLNANTSPDRTYYYEVMPSHQLELALYLESERMLHLRVDSFGVKTQKNVVIEEKKQSYDNRPYGGLLSETMKRAFTTHPYHWTTIGDPAHIMAATDEDFLKFYKTYYVPNNATLTIVGDFNPVQAKEWVKKYYAEIPKGTLPMLRPDVNMEPKQTVEVRDTVYDNIQLPAIVMGYKIPAAGTPDFYAMSMLNKILSDGKSSRLYTELVDKQQKALQIMAVSIPYVHPGLSLVFGLPNMGVKLDEFEPLIQVQLDRMKNELVSDRELQKAKNQVESDMINGMSSLANRAEELASNYTFFKNANLINTEIEEYNKVTAEDIKRVANMYMQKENRVVLYWLAKK